MGVVNGVLNVLFVVWEIGMVYFTPALLLIGTVVWGAMAARSREGRGIALCGAGINLLLGIAWTVLFAPVFLSEAIAWPGWVLATAPARGAAFYLTWLVALGADFGLRHLYRASHRPAETLSIPAITG